MIGKVVFEIVEHAPADQPPAVARLWAGAVAYILPHFKKFKGQGACPFCGQVPKTKSTRNFDGWMVTERCEHLVCHSGQDSSPSEVFKQPRSWGKGGKNWHPWPYMDGWPVSPTHVIEEIEGTSVVVQIFNHDAIPAELVQLIESALPVKDGPVGKKQIQRELKLKDGWNLF